MAFREADDETSAAMKDGRRWRRIVKRAKVEARNAGIEWKDARALHKAFGVPGEHPESRKAWLALAKKNAASVFGPDPRAIDWDKIAAFIERVLPLIMSAFAGC